MEPNYEYLNADPPVRITVGDLLDISDLFNRIWQDPIAAPIVNELLAWIPPGQNDTMDLIRGETSGMEIAPVGLEDLTVYFEALTFDDPLSPGEFP